MIKCGGEILDRSRLLIVILLAIMTMLSSIIVICAVIDHNDQYVLVNDFSLIAAISLGFVSSLLATHFLTEKFDRSKIPLEF